MCALNVYFDSRRTRPSTRPTFSDDTTSSLVNIFALAVSLFSHNTKPKVSCFGFLVFIVAFPFFSCMEVELVVVLGVYRLHFLTRSFSFVCMYPCLALAIAVGIDGMESVCSTC